MHRNTVLDMGALIPPGGGRGIAEEVGDLGFGELVRDVNGRAFGLRVPGRDKYSFSYSGTGDWALPAFQDVERFDEVTLSAIRPWTTAVPAGMSAFTLSRDCADPASVWIARADGTVVPRADWTLAGRTGTILSQGQACSVFWRPRVQVLLDRKSFDGKEWDAVVNWRVEFVEV